MIKSNKLKLIASSIAILLPMLVGIIFWNELPDSMTTHFGADGNADGTSSKVFAVFALPIILLAVHWLCVLCTAYDHKNRTQSEKVFGMVLWIMPVLSVFVNGLMYAVALEAELDLVTWTFLVMAVMFIFIGNYLPKCQPNHTIGVKIKWTLGNEENWSATHRVAGITWVACGIVMLIGAFLPMKVAVPAMIAVFVIAVAVPMIYSYCFYKKQIANGVEYSSELQISKTGKIITAVMIPLILVFVFALMFTGNIKMQYEEDSFTVEASYYDDLTIDYAEIDSVEYRDSFKAGYRLYGFGSPRLSLGGFENDEFGKYTLYAYTASDSAVVITVDDEVLVISGKDAGATKAIYDEIIARIK